MKTKLLAALLLCVPLVAGLVSGCGAGNQNTDKTAGIAAAKAWLGLIDQGQYAESWNEASPFFQGAVTEPNWTNALVKVRQPLGDLVSRNLISAKEVSHLPDAPDGRYVVMQFETSFANKPSAIETVTVGPKQNGQWQASGYYIK